MTAAPTLNPLASTHGAVMVSGTLWKTYSYTPDGLFSAKYSSGPLILWAKSGEGESLPTLQPPALSALEEQTAKLNTRAAFERLFWAARGKVRPSVRWKTGWKIRKQKTQKELECLSSDYLLLRFVSGTLVFEGFSSLTFEQAIKDNSVWCVAPPTMLKMFSRRKRARIAALRREESFQEAYRVLYADKLSKIGRPLCEMTQEDAEKRLKEIRSSDERLERIFRALDLRHLPNAEDLRNMAADSEVNCSLLGLIRYFTRHHFSFCPIVFRFLRDLTGFTTLKGTELLKHLEAAAYRAHLAKRVKPVTRRTRAPRPLYARPRPPTAPTAPPLLEA